MSYKHPISTETIHASLPTDVMARASSRILLVPERWPLSGEKQSIYAGATQSVIKLAKINNLPIDLLDENLGEIQCRENRSADWIGPTMFVSSMLLTDNPTAVSIALNVLSNYITDAFKGLRSDPNVELAVVYSNPKTKRFTRVKYTGPVAGLEELKEIILGLNKNS